MKLSVIIPAHNEVESIGEAVQRTVAVLERATIEHEILVIDDASGDGTAEVVDAIAMDNTNVRCIRSPLPQGFGYAVRAGLDLYAGDAVAIMMADLSDSPTDLVLYYRVLEQGYDCAFGTRFGSGGQAQGYPLPKLVLNRFANAGIRALFQHGYGDTTNAFKAYRRPVINQLQPLLSNHFNLTVELPLKAVVRGFRYAVVPVTWTNRRTGTSKLRLHEMGSRYLFIVLYVWLEAHLSRGDYRRKDLIEVAQNESMPSWSPPEKLIQAGTSARRSVNDQDKREAAALEREPAEYVRLPS
jgi:dolichol-phosphate mannosyltransferase